MRGSAQAWPRVRVPASSARIERFSRHATCSASANDYFRASMKLSAQLAIYSALASLLLMAGCKKKEPTEPALTHPAASAPSAAAPSVPLEHGQMPGMHPGVMPAAQDKLDEAETEALAARAQRADATQAKADALAKTWNATCQVHRKCAEPPPLPDCKSTVIAHEWGELEYDADKAAGQIIEVEGPLALSPVHPAGKQKCAPGVCCHTLDMNIVLDGRPNALALPGFTCHGDDSSLCCKVPANGQMVTAKGKLQKAPPGSPLKWQLTQATFCTVHAAPAAPSMGMGTGPG